MAVKKKQHCKSGRSVNTALPPPETQTLKTAPWPLRPTSFRQTSLVRIFVTPCAGRVELGSTACQLTSQEEVPQRDSFQQGTRVWKLVCSSLLREELLGSRWDGAKSHVPLTKLASRIERNPLEAKHTGGQRGGGTNHKLNPKERACLGGSRLLGAKLTRQTLGSHFATVPHTTKCCGSRPYRQSGWPRQRP